MSVWQTLLHAALLRLPESLGRQGVMKRYTNVLCTATSFVFGVLSCCLYYLINNLTMLFSFLNFTRALEVLQLVELHFARDVSTADQSKSLSAVYRTFSREPTLSTYERQCLRLAVQLLNAPQAIFLDEVSHLLFLFVALCFSLFLFVSLCCH